MKKIIKTNNKILLLILFLFLANSCSQKIQFKSNYSINRNEDSQSGIRGIIKARENNQPLEYAFARIVSNEFKKDIRTDKEGNFNIDLTPGEYSVEFISVGFKQLFIKKVHVKSNERITFKVFLGSSIIY
ncbi:carboxypeptidase regulatory-like domain-containing protein [Pedobacter montanisoli]|uniref:Carboxypeptidase-like regulatory domain-containing protein n=1 Tax=Pedobacter montanisoli TaxID=2923277 RepID=A0ABS9ZZY7_9SPHI|nr:carboxypeptidase regulatory-like domain-containing protein [Pedobacter montanisoli]MCJ0743871.1 carboxypeptidase-like regulatory domain-containing protein [Pedobacter montanisoli]